MVVGLLTFGLNSLLFYLPFFLVEVSSPFRFQKRNRMEIVYEILKTSDGFGVAKTGLVYRVNSNFKRIEELLKILTARGLLEKVVIDGRTIYRTTHIGRNVLAHLEEAIKAMSD